MADTTRYYDLMVMLDPESPEPARAQVIEQVRGQISSGSGDLKGDADWGMRRLAYEIDHRSEAQYHLFQLQAENELLEQLDRNLSIEDAVLRHRIIRLPGEPPAVTPRVDPGARAIEDDSEAPAAPAETSEPAAEVAPATPEEPAAVETEVPAAEAAPAEPAAEAAPATPEEQSE